MDLDVETLLVTARELIGDSFLENPEYVAGIVQLISELIINQGFTETSEMHLLVKYAIKGAL